MSLFTGLFGKKSEERVIGVDIGSSAIKIVQLRKKGAQAILETYGALALGPYGGAAIGQAVQLSPDKVALALTDLMKEREVNITTKRSGLSIPFASSLMSVIEMPPVSSQELATMVPFEARKYIPVPIGEVTLDWSVIPRNEVESSGETEAVSQTASVSGKIEVLVVAIHNETIARYQKIAEVAGLDAGFFEIELFSTQRSVLDEALRPVLIMDMGAATTKLYIVERGVIKASHTVSRGSQDITAALARSLGVPVEQAEIMKREVGLTGSDQDLTDVIKLVLDYIFAEINNVVLAFEKKYNKTVAKTILVGGGAALKGLRELAQIDLKTEVETGMPFNKVSAPAFLDKILHDIGPEFAVAIGLALRRLAEGE